MSLYKKYKISSDLTANGIWLVFDDCRIKVLPSINAYNQKFKKAYSDLWPDDLELATKNRDEQERVLAVLAEIYAEAVVLDWDGVTDENNKLLEYSKKNVVKVLVDLEEFFTEIIRRTSDYSNFREALVTKQKKS